MRVLDRYTTREFITVLIFGIVALLLVSTVVDLFERAGSIIEFKPPVTVTLTYFLARMPQVVLMITPISMLLATLLVTGAFARNSEVTAMLASGVSIYRMMVPLLAIGFVVSLLMFGLNEFIIPTANRIAEENKRVMRGKPDMRKMAKIQIWFRENQEKRIYYINALIPESPEGQQIQGLTIFELNDQFLPVKRLDVLRAIYKPKTPAATAQTQKSWKTKIGEFFKPLVEFFYPLENHPEENDIHGTWTLYQGTERSLESSGRKTIFNFQERRDYPIRPSFNDFRRETKDPEEMNYLELMNYIAALTASGYDVSQYIVDLRAKFSYPIVSLVMVIIGFPFALKSPRSGAAMGLGISVFIGLSYWIILQLGISLGHAGILPPLVAAWISHIIFASAGFYLILSTRT